MLTDTKRRGLFELNGLVAKYHKLHHREIYELGTACVLRVWVSYEGEIYSLVEDCDIEPTTFFEGSLCDAKKFMAAALASGEILDPDNF